MLYFVMASGIFNIVMAFVITARDYGSAILFRVIPFFFGLGNLLYAVKMLGWM